MTIYTRFGSEVKLTAARLIPVWIEHQGFRIKWHYVPKEPTKRTKELTETPIWHVKAEYVEGGLVNDGKWIVLSDFVGDGGWAVIQAECERLNPEDKAAYETWNTSPQWKGENGPKASAAFKLEPKKNIA